MTTTRKVYTGTADSGGQVKVCDKAWKENDPPMIQLWWKMGGKLMSSPNSHSLDASGCLGRRHGGARQRRTRLPDGGDPLVG